MIWASIDFMSCLQYRFKLVLFNYRGELDNLNFDLDLGSRQGMNIRQVLQTKAE